MLEEKVEMQDLLSWLCRIGEQIQFPLLISDPNSENEPIVYVNKKFAKLLDNSNNEIIGRSKTTLLNEFFNFHIETDELLEYQNADLVDHSSIISKKNVSYLFYDISEQTLCDHDGLPIFSLSFLVDISKYKEDTYKLAYFDNDSHLPNYQYFTEHFEKSIEITSSGFLLQIQPSEYASISDEFGKKHLGFLLKELQKRFSEILVDIPTLIVVTTDGTLIVSVNCSKSDIKTYVENIFQAVNEPILVFGIELFITLKIGATSFEFFKGNIDEFVRLSNIALSHSKKQAGNSISYYKDQFSVDLKQKMVIQNQLVHALKNHDILVHFQPKVNISDGKIVSFEALARWYSPSLGQVPPDIFIEAAENIGKIEELDFLIIKQVLNWLLKRKESNLSLFQVSVNISPSHFYTPNFIEKLLNMVNQYCIDPQYIKIELTENIGLVDLKRAKQIINELKQYGFECSVDDFGIGFSSLSYLHQLPVNELKIDRSFINNLHDNGGSAVVKTIIQLATSMNLTAVAEGIESEQQLEVIRSMSCEVAQGYYFYKPMSLLDIDELLTNEAV